MAHQNKVSEASVIEAFHSLARISLSEAEQDGLIDDAFLEEATPEELQILGPALTLLFAAWKNTTNPPAVYVPESPSNPPFTLSIATCPTNLLPLFRLFQRTVNPLQKLTTEQAHDVARLICDLEPVTSPVSTIMVKLAADVQAIAIQISQRKTFMERYTQDLQTALHRRSGSFHSAPQYTPPSMSYENAGSFASEQDAQEPPAVPPRRPVSMLSSEASQSASSMSSQYHQDAQTIVGAIPQTEDPDVISVRETLYAVLAEVMSTSKALGSIIKQDPARGYFTAVALAVVEAAMNALTPDGQRVRVLALRLGGPQSFSSIDAPPAYRVFVRAIISLGAALRSLEERDNDRAIELAMSGQDDNMSLTRIEVLKQELEQGLSDDDSVHEAESRQLRETAEMRTIANQINRMALAVTSLPGFRDRKGVFDILQGVSPAH